MLWSFFFWDVAEIERVLLRIEKNEILEKYVEFQGYRTAPLNSKKIEVEEEINPNQVSSQHFLSMVEVLRSISK